MTIPNLNVDVLKRLISLQEKREKLAKELASVEAEMTAVIGGKAPAAEKKAKAAPAPAPVKKAKPAPARRAPRKGGGRKRGATGEKIVSAIKSAGKEGITVKRISDKTGIPTQNLYVWFNTTGKKIKEIVKIAPATYRYEG